MADRLFASARVTRTATPAELSALETAICRLPPSYRSFAETYGDGLTNGLILVFMPFKGRAGDFLIESGGLKSILDDFVSEWIADGGRPGEPDCLEPYERATHVVLAR